MKSAFQLLEIMLAANARVLLASSTTVNILSAESSSSEMGIKDFCHSPPRRHKQDTCNRTCSVGELYSSVIPKKLSKSLDPHSCK